MRSAPARPRRAATGCLVFGALAWVAACSSSTDPSTTLPIGEGPGEAVTETFNPPEVVPPLDVPTALVIDSGFDLSDPALQGRIAGAFHEVCEPAPARAIGTFEEEKKAALASLAVSDRSCHLEPGVTLVRSAWLDALAPLREAWNNRVRAGTIQADAKDTRMWAALSGDDTFQYHGTRVLGLLAYRTPNVRFVVVGKELAPPSEKGKARCPTPGLVALSTRLLLDADYQRAYLERPVARLTEDYTALYERFHVRYQNESFGYPARAEREASCPRDPWAAYYAAAGALAVRARAARDPKLFPLAELLTTVAAGNNEAEVSSPSDAIACSASTTRSPRSATLIVGATETHSDVLASFSNHGACVDVYSPGTYLLSTTAHGFLLPFSGTSASAPLTLRHALVMHPGLSPVDARGAILAEADTRKILASRLFPRELRWPPAGASSTSSALAVAERDAARATPHAQLLRREGVRLPLEPSR